MATGRKDGGGQLSTVELNNDRPVDLRALSDSLAALAEDFEEFSSADAPDPLPGNMRLYVREMRSGSIIADLIPLGKQLDWIFDHKDVLGSFVSHLNHVAEYFLGSPQGKSEKVPTRQEAQRLAQIVEPVAQDSAAQINIQASDSAKVEFHAHFHVGYVQANAIQNNVGKFLGPQLPALEVFRDRIMTLHQMKNEASSKSGDRGLIESVWPRAVRLQFLSDDAKQQVLSLDENPFQKAFRVDVEVQSANGRPALYRIIAVKDVIDMTDED